MCGFVKAELASNAREICLFDFFVESCAGFTGSFKAGKQKVGSVISESGEHAGLFIVFFFVFVDEGLQFITGIERCVGSCVEDVVRIFSTNLFDEVMGIETISTYDGFVYAISLQSLNDLSGFIVVTGDVNNIEILFLSFCNDRLEVLIAGLIFSFINSLATKSLQLFFERILQATSVIGSFVEDDGFFRDL